MTFLRSISDPGASDLELVQAYRQSGDLEVLAQLYSRYMDLLYGVCLRYLEDQEQAQDAVMQVFEQLISKLLRHEVSNFRSWLYTLAKNHCLMQLRSMKKSKIVSLPEEFVQSEPSGHLNGETLKELQLQLMEKCLQNLSQEQQQTVTLFYLQQKSYHEIVAETGLDWNKVRSLIQNGRRNLKICMDNHQE